MKSLNELFDQYERAHVNKYNRLCHLIGIPLILLSIGMSVVSGINLLNFSLFFIGWGFQFIGHAIEGTKPEFLKNPIFLVIGVLYFAKKIKRIFKTGD